MRWRRSSRSCHDIPHARQLERGLSFAATGVVTRGAVDRLVARKARPVEVGREIRTPLHVSEWIDVNGSNARLAGFAHFAADESRNLLEVIVRVRDHAPLLSLERQKLSDQSIDRRNLGGANE